MGVGYVTNIPALVAITDFDFPDVQWKYINFVDERYTRYIIPRADKLFFRRMFTNLSQENILSALKPSRTEILFNYFFAPSARQTLLTKEVQDQLRVFRIVGYPVNPIIAFPKDMEDVKSAREKMLLNLDEGRKTVTVTFGSAPTTTQVEALLRNLLSVRDSLRYPIQIALLTAGNESIGKLAEKVFAEYSVPLLVESDYAQQKTRVFPDKVIAKIFPRIDRAGVSSMNKASDLILSKAGGATTAELFESSAYYLRTTNLHLWEVENAIYLEKLGLSIRTPASATEDLGVDYSPYLKDLNAQELLAGMNQILARPRILGRLVDGYRSYKRENVLKAASEMIADFARTAP
jgi:UDP:flavonoid glycosyltransferase YjiC (YdhE family)